MKIVAVSTKAEVSKVDRDRLVLRFGTMRVAMNRDEAIEVATRLADVAAELSGESSEGRHWLR